MVIVEKDNPARRKYIGHGLFPTWSPTSDTIVFQRARERGTRWFSVWTVQIVDGDAGPMTEIAASTNAAVITPDWSPDGKQIVFCTVIDPGADDQIRPTQADVWVMNADGTGRARLTNGRFANLQPAWSPDGSVMFVSDRGAEGIDNVWAMRPDRAVQLAQQEQAPQQEEASTSVMVPTE
jgi:Tol biopolymer transport system component